MSWKTKYCEALALALPKHVNSLGLKILISVVRLH